MASKYAAAFQSDEGKAVVRDLCASFGVTALAFVKGQDSHAAAIQEGKRTVVMHILRMISKGEKKDHITIPVTP